MSNIGTLVKVKIGAVELIGEVSASITAACNLIDVSSKASGNQSNFEYGRVTESGSFSSLASTTASETKYGYDEALQAMYDQTKIACEITEYDAGGSEVVGAHKFAFTALIGNATWDIPDNDRMTFSMDISVDGKTTVTTNA